MPVITFTDEYGEIATAETAGNVTESELRVYIDAELISTLRWQNEIYAKSRLTALLDRLYPRHMLLWNLLNRYVWWRLGRP